MARKTARHLWTARIAGRPLGSLESSRLETTPGAKGKVPFRGTILGIDPSLRGTGLALIEMGSSKPLLIRSTKVSVPIRHSVSEALAEIHRSVARYIDSVPGLRHVAIERTIYVQN